MYVHMEWETGLQRQAEFQHFPSGEGFLCKLNIIFGFAGLKKKMKIGKPFFFNFHFHD